MVHQSFTMRDMILVMRWRQAMTNKLFNILVKIYVKPSTISRGAGLATGNLPERAADPRTP